MNYFNAIAVLIATLASLVAVGLHYEILEYLTRWIHKRSVRGKIYLTVVCVVGAHVLEIQIFAVLYWITQFVPSFGSIVPAESFFDYVYYSSVVYTTVGFGDIVPTGPIRLVTAIESLIGLVLITWSATFIYVNRTKDD